MVMTQGEQGERPAAAKRTSPREEGRHDDGLQGPGRARAPSRGEHGAQVTIVEFSDFQCPYCSRVEPTLKQIREKYGDKVRLVWKNEPLPFHPRAEPAAEVALEARAEKGDKGFWDVHDKLFASQPKLEDADLEKVAPDAGLSLDKVRERDEDPQVQGGHRRRRATSPTTCRRAGRRTSSSTAVASSGAQPPEKFAADHRRGAHQDAGAPRARGRRPTRLYETIIKDGKGAPAPEKKNVAGPAERPVARQPNAKVTIVEFSDFQCPFCKRAEDAVNEVMKNYGDKIKFVWRNMPLPMHPDAPLAAQAAMEAYKQKGSDGFWKMHDLLFANQPSKDKQDGLKREALDGYAQQLGLDMDKWKAALDSAEPQARGRRRREGGQRPRHQWHAGVPHQRLLHQRRAAVPEVPQAHRARARRGEVAPSHVRESGRIARPFLLAPPTNPWACGA